MQPSVTSILLPSGVRREPVRLFEGYGRLSLSGKARNQR